MRAYTKEDKIYKSSLSTVDISQDVSDAIEVVRHGLPFDFLRSKVTKGCLIFQKILKQDAHNLGLLTRATFASKEYLHIRQSHVITMLDIVQFKPFHELGRLDLQMVLPNNFVDYFRLHLHTLVQPTKEHSKEVGISITSLFLMPIFHLGQVLQSFVALDRFRNDLCWNF